MPTSDLIYAVIEEMESHIDLQFNEVQNTYWVALLGHYEDDVLIEGWSDFIDSLIPKRKPFGLQAKKIFDPIRMKKKNVFHAPLDVSIEDKSFGSKVALACMKSLAYAKSVNGGLPAYHSDQSRFWSEVMKEPKMAKNHARLAKAKSEEDFQRVLADVMIPIRYR